MPLNKGVLLVNLGTPDTPSNKDVFRYLNEFLTDPRVIDYPWLKRQLLVRGIIVPFRYKASAASYREIWDERGSPLKYHTFDAAEKLQAILKGDYQVEVAMRYQNPSIRSALQKLKGVKELTVIPLFPQYASATTGSVFDKVMEEITKWQILPKLKMIDAFYNHPKVIQAFAQNAKPFELTSYDKVLFSFHGLPVRQLKKASPVCKRDPDCCQKNFCCYSAQSYKMADLIAQELNLAKDRYEICFQSRLGKEPWIEPYTSDVIRRLSKEGAKKLLVFCPAFVADCLETIHEIGVEYNEEFQASGGERIDLVPSLNSSDTWVEALKVLTLA